ncbi:MAG: hypothetical protein JWR14_4551 [Caballeronia sp.]|nr:hypothetical protein [Caballeronia sp.]
MRPRTKTACMFGMPDIIVPWFLPVSKEPARGTCSWNLSESEIHLA